MKLNKENFTKTIEKDIVRYSYNCNDTDFYLELVGQNKDRNINVFSGSLEERKNLLTTKNSLEAWNHFENLLNECSGEQGSSGGGNLGNNPQQNPNILPLLSINSTSGGVTKLTLFAIMEDKTQTRIFNFEVSANTIPQPIPQNVFTVDWTNEDVTQLLKCEVILKEYDAIKFDEEPNSKVFLFIPKSIANQGGEEGGNTEGGDDETGEDGQPKKDKGDKKRKNKDQKAKPTDEPGDDDDGEPVDDDGEPIDDDGEPTNKRSKEKGDDDGEPGDDDGEPIDDDGKPKDKRDDNVKPGEQQGDEENEEEDENENKEPGNKKYDFTEVIQKIADTTDGDYNPNELLSIFRNVESGELWLTSNDFPKIKKDLNLPPTTTARQFSQEIINSK
jgi:hypothetical protein